MPDAPRQLPPKKDVANALLEGPSVFVHLDPRREGVVVPKWFTGQPQLVLQVGLNMAIPIHDLKVEDDAITCTLSFNRSPFWCRLPFSAIYALVGEDSRGMVWPEDVPPEVAMQMQKQAGATPAAVKTPAKKGRPKLNAVDGGAAEPKSKKPRGLRGSSAAADSPSVEEVTHDGEAQESAGSGKPRLSLAEPARPASSTGQAPGRAPGDSAHAGPASKHKKGQPDASLEEEAAATPRATDGGEDAAASDKRKPSDPGKKAKRELPPYLRVIK